MKKCLTFLLITFTLKTMKTMKLSRRTKITVDKLLEWIGKNNIGVHERIPNMAKLSKELGTSVNTVHSAVRYLSSLGILDTEIGSGTFLIRPIDKIEKINDEYESSAERDYTIGLIVCEELAELFRTKVDALNRGGWGCRILSGIHQAGIENRVNIQPIGIELKLWKNPTVEDFVSTIESQLTGVNGLISFPLRRHVASSVLEKLGLPWVLINPPDDLSTTNYVSPDYYGASVIVGQIAARLEAKNIWVLTLLPNWPSNRQRICGIRDGIMFEHGKFDGITIVTSRDVLYEDGIIAIREAVERYRQLPDFIYAAGDFLAEAAVDFVKSKGLIPGKDVSVISSTGLPELEKYQPPISTVKLPMLEIGKTAVAMLLRMLKTNQHTLPAKIIPAPVILRETTPPEAKDILEQIEREHTQQRNTEIMMLLP